MKDSLVTVGGGRQLSYVDIGDPDGPSSSSTGRPGVGCNL